MSVRTDLIKVYGKGYDKGLKHFKDMLSDNGKIWIWFNLNINSIVDAIPPKWKKAVKTVKLDDNNSFQEDFIL